MDVSWQSIGVDALHAIVMAGVLAFVMSLCAWWLGD